MAKINPSQATLPSGVLADYSTALTDKIKQSRLLFGAFLIIFTVSMVIGALFHEAMGSTYLLMDPGEFDHQTRSLRIMSASFALDTTPADLSRAWRDIQDSSSFWHILTTNLSSMLLAYVYSIPTGVMAILLTVKFGLQFGLYLAYPLPFLLIIAPHGFLELLAIVIWLALGFELGVSLLRVRGGAYFARQKAVISKHLVIFPAFLLSLILAAAIEAYVTRFIRVMFWG